MPRFTKPRRWPIPRTASIFTGNSLRCRSSIRNFHEPSRLDRGGRRLIAVACQRDKIASPTNPTVSLATLFVQAPQLTSVAPGKTVQMGVVARFTDGSERNVTSDSSWSSSQIQVATVVAGVITGNALGRAQIRAQYQSRSVSISIVVKPEGTFVVSGNITEPGAISIPGATVTVLGSVPAYQVVSPSGFYELFGVSGTVTLLVSKPGCLDETWILEVTQDQKVDPQIKPITAPAPIAGDYRMTLRISPRCSAVPDDQRIRTYTANIVQDNARLTIRLSDATFVPSKNVFGGQDVGAR